MLENLFGSTHKERILFYLAARQEGYARGIAAFFATNLRGIQIQLDNLESGGVLVSRMEGRTRLYSFNPRWPLRNELLALVTRAMDFLPETERAQLLENRRRPRRRAKPQ